MKRLPHPLALSPLTRGIYSTLCDQSLIFLCGLCVSAVNFLLELPQ